MAQKSQSKKKNVGKISKKICGARVHNVGEVKEIYTHMIVTEVGMNNGFVEVKADNLDFKNSVVGARPSHMLNELFEEEYRIYKRLEGDDTELSLDTFLGTEFGDLETLIEVDFGKYGDEE